MVKKIILYLITAIFSVNLVYAAYIVEDINITAASGGDFSNVANYNVNDTNIGHTIPKSATGTIDSLSDLSQSISEIQTINKVKLLFRHGGENGISNSWTITFRNEAGTTTYCTDNSIAHQEVDTYLELDITSACSFTASELNDLEITLNNGDGAGGDDAYVYYFDLVINYTTFEYGTLNYSVNLDSIANLNLYDIYELNTTITCTGNAGDICGSVTTYPRYNSTETIPNTEVSSTIGTIPLFVNGTILFGNKEISGTPTNSIYIGGTIFVPEGATYVENDNKIWYVGSSPDLIYEAYSNGTLTGTSIDISNEVTTGTCIANNNTHLFVGFLTDDNVYIYKKSTGTYIGSFISTGSKDTNLEGCSIHNDILYTVGTQTDNIYLFYLNGTYKSNFTTNTITENPLAIHVDDEFIYVMAEDQFSILASLKRFYLNGTFNKSFTLSYDDVPIAGLTFNNSHFITTEQGGDIVKSYYYNYSLVPASPLSQTMVAGDEWNVSFFINVTEAKNHLLQIYFESDKSQVTNVNFTNNILFNLTGYTPPTDTCTYGGVGDWNIDLSDNCIITTTVNLPNNKIILTGSGSFTIGNGGKVICNEKHFKPTKPFIGNSYFLIGIGGELNIKK